MRIEPDDLSNPRLLALLTEHLQHMHRLCTGDAEADTLPLPLQDLIEPGLSFWTAWEGRQLLCCGALLPLDDGAWELKLLRTAQAWRRQGVGRAMLRFLVATARARGGVVLYAHLGRDAAFAVAQHLCASVGFEPGEPYGEAEADPDSVFMRLPLRPLPEPERRRH